MRRYTFYLAVTFLAFVIGSLVAAIYYYNTDITNDIVENPLSRNARLANGQVKRVELLNRGFNELETAEDGDLVTVQGGIDEKFICHDVTELQPGICTTALLGNGTDGKFLVVRLKVCSDEKSNCIVWKPDNLCANGELCSDRIRIYDNDSNFTELNKRIGKNSFYIKNVKLKVTAKVSKTDGKARLLSSVEKIEITEIK